MENILKKIRKIDPIVAAFVLMFLVSSSLLFWSSNRNSNPDFRKDWWVVYFFEAKGGDLDFWIENHSGKETFKMELFEGKKKLWEEDVFLKKGEKTRVGIDERLVSEGGKVSIEVRSGDEVKSISKNL